MSPLLTINRMAERDVEAIIDGVAGIKPIPESVRKDIIERTDGIPLFVEEMTKAVLEAESEGSARHWPLRFRLLPTRSRQVYTPR